MTYSMDSRERVVAAVNNGESTTIVARRLSVSRPAVRDWQNRTQRCKLTPGVPGRKGPTKLIEADDNLMRQQISQRPGITAR